MTFQEMIFLLYFESYMWKPCEGTRDREGSRMEVQTVEAANVTDVKFKGILILYPYSVPMDIYIYTLYGYTKYAWIFIHLYINIHI